MPDERTITREELARALFLWNCRHEWADEEAEIPAWGSDDSKLLRASYYEKAQELFELARS